MEILLNYKENEEMSFTEKWLELDIITLNENSQEQKPSITCGH
jgi:hypothetical protein